MVAKLPSDIIQLVSENFTSLETHLAFSQTCTSVREVYSEVWWKRVLCSFGYSRPLLHKTVKWSFLPVMISCHTAACVVCKDVAAQYGKPRLDNATQVLSKVQVAQVRELDILKGIKEIASATSGRLPTSESLDSGFFSNNHLIAYYFFRFDLARDRPHIQANKLKALQSVFQKAYRRDMNGAEYKKASLLASHIVISSLLATTLPVATLSLAVKEPKFTSTMWGRGRDPNSGPCKLTPTVVTNQDGVTVHDLFRAGANWNQRPGGSLNGTLFYGVSLDKKTSTATFVFEEPEIMDGW